MKALKQQCLRTGQLTAERLIAAQERTHLQMYMALQQLRAARKAREAQELSETAEMARRVKFQADDCAPLCRAHRAIAEGGRRTAPMGRGGGGGLEQCVGGGGG